MFSKFFRDNRNTTVASIFKSLIKNYKMLFEGKKNLACKRRSNMESNKGQ